MRRTLFRPGSGPQGLAHRLCHDTVHCCPVGIRFPAYQGLGAKRSQVREPSMWLAVSEEEQRSAPTRRGHSTERQRQLQCQLQRRLCPPSPVHPCAPAPSLCGLLCAPGGCPEPLVSAPPRASGWVWPKRNGFLEGEWGVGAAPLLSRAPSTQPSRCPGQVSPCSPGGAGTHPRAERHPSPKLGKESLYYPPLPDHSARVFSLFPAGLNLIQSWQDTRE